MRANGISDHDPPERARYRTKVGLDVAMEGLREGLRRRRCTPDELWRHAHRTRVWSVMRPYLEAMVFDAA
jgi:hypothetical protein